MSSAVPAPDKPSSRSDAISVAPLNVTPVAPEQIQRYLRREPIVKEPNIQSIRPGKIDYTETAPGMWRRIVHPEGARYFFNPHKQVFTDIDLEKESPDEVDRCISFLRERENQVVSGPRFQATPATQLVIQLNEGLRDDKREWLYYFVNHETRAIFWVDEFETKKLSALQYLQGVTTVSHIGYEIEFQYWLHCEQYPNCIYVSQDHVTQFYGMIVHARADYTTSEAPLSALDEPQLAKLLTLAPHLQSRVGVIDEYVLWVVARVMRIFARTKFYNFYGQPGARLEADLPLYLKDGGAKRFSWFALLDTFLFYTPSAHIKDLQDCWVDNVINYARWEAFSHKLNNEWGGLAIYSTVMLAVNVSFLAVPGVNNGDVGSQSVAVIAIYVSLLSIFGSLYSSILLMRRGLAQDNSVSGTASFIYTRTRWGGPKALGVMYSLPLALLIWAMILFILALSYVIFRSSDRITLGVLGASAILVGSLILLPVWWGPNYSRQWLKVARNISIRVRGVGRRRDEV